MARVLKLTMVGALEYLASLYRDENEGQTIIEDEYCSTCTIDAAIATIGFDYPRDLIVGVGGIYAPDEMSPGGARPIYRVVC